MEGQLSLWKGIRPLVGTVIGVGFFSVPFVFSRAGFWLAFGELVILAIAQALLLHMYADLVLAKKGRVRFLHIIADAFGPLGRSVAVVSFFGALWGSMIACLIVGGEFLSYVVRAWFSVSESHMSILVGIVLMVALGGGMFIVERIRRYLVPFFFISIAVLFFFGLPEVHGANLSLISWSSWTLPLGVLLFSLSGISAIPEIRDVMKGNGHFLHRAVTWGMVLVAIIYAIFSALVVGIAGGGTSSQAIAAFASVAPWMVLLGSLFGFTTISTAYMHVGSALINTLIYDFRLRYIWTWALIGGVPVLTIMLGIHDVIHVLEYAGGVLSALLGIFVLLAYEKARRTHQLPVHTRAYSSLLVFGVFAIFFAILVLTLRG